MPYTAITKESRHPFEVNILLAAAIAGIVAVFGDLWPTSIEKVFPHWLQLIWGIFFGGGALLALWGIHMKHRPNGILLEQIGLSAVGVASVLYAGALLRYNFEGSLAVSILMLLIGSSCGQQWWRLEKTVRSAVDIKEGKGDGR